jgi:NitT/TauT family transport system permease protein
MACPKRPLGSSTRWCGASLAYSLLSRWQSRGNAGAQRTFTPFQLPALTAVLERIWNDAVAGDLWINTALTLYRAWLRSQFAHSV